MSTADRTTYELIEEFISEFPYPIRGTDLVTHYRWYNDEGFRFYREDLPYTVYYLVDEHEITITQVLRSATNRTPL